MDRVMTNKIRAAVLNGGMDIVGFAPVDRWETAPFLLSPPAILPECKTVIVAGLSITDTWTEMGGEPHPQDASPGGWMDQNCFMDRIGYKTAKLLHKYGYKAIPIVSSNIWRYRLAEGIDSLFAPDLSHMHAAVAAGLAEMGWSGLAITPEFGPRVRFVSIVTDAVLEPTPMYNGPKLCDMCMECVKCCPSAAMRKDFNGQPHVITIGGKTFRYANKNIWRCAWAEHFDLDLDSATLKEDHIDESTIVDEVNAKGRRGHERGVCQKVCIPPHLRQEKPSFGRKDKLITMNRVNRRYPDSMPTLRKMRDDLAAAAENMGVELVAVGELRQDSPAGRLLEVRAPGMKTVMGFAFEIPPETVDLDKYSRSIEFPYWFAAMSKMHHTMFRLARSIEEYGYNAASFHSTLPMHNLENSMGEYDVKATHDPIPLIAYELCEMAGLGKIGDMFEIPDFGTNVVVGAIVTDAPLEGYTNGAPAQRRTPVLRDSLKEVLKNQARQNGVDLFGVAAGNAFDQTVEDLKANLGDTTKALFVTDANHKASRHGAYIPEIVSEDQPIATPKQHLPGAQSVIVLGMGFPGELIENAGLAETKQVGPYSFWTFHTVYELRFAALELAGTINRAGYSTLIHENLLGIGSKTDTPRGIEPDFRCGSLEAYAAGLGEIGKSGALLTSEFGPHQRFIAIITDAPLEADMPHSGRALCTKCGECASKCPMNAVNDCSFPLRIADRTISYPMIHRNRCDWAKRYSLHQDEGTGMLGVTTHVTPDHEGEVTIEEIAAACAKKDPITKTRTTILEPCLIKCRWASKGE